jgi:hypothetical protein
MKAAPAPLHKGQLLVRSHRPYLPSNPTNPCLSYWQQIGAATEGVLLAAAAGISRDARPYAEAA